MVQYIKKRLAILFTFITFGLSAQWSYDTIYSPADTNRQHPGLMATCESMDTVFISHPEVELVRGTLVVTTIQNNGWVALYVSRARIKGSSKDTSVIRMKFDDDAPEDYYYRLSSDPDKKNLIFIIEGEKFMSRLLISKKLRASVELVDNGSFDFIFDTVGLKW